MCSMAKYRNNHNLSRESGDVNRKSRRSRDKTRNLKRELGELGQQEKDYMENLANSLLKIQNTPLPRTNEKGKKKNEKKRGANEE